MAYSYYSYSFKLGTINCVKNPIGFLVLYNQFFYNSIKEKKNSGQENVKEECNSTTAILSVGDTAKYEVVEIVA